MLKNLLLSTLFISYSLFASEVLLVAKSQKAFLASPDETKKWKVGDALCTKGRDGVGGCGKIVKITPKGYYVSVTLKKREITKGMAVLKTSRLPASLGSSKEVIDTKQKRIIELSGGTQFSLHYLIPFVKAEYKILDHIGVAVSPYFFLGSLPITSTVSLDFKTLGLSFSGSYYQYANLTGFFGSVGFGPNLYMMSSGTYSDSEIKLGAYLSAGYHYRINPQLSLIGTLGAQYLPVPDAMNALTDYSSLQPYGTVSVGYLF